MAKWEPNKSETSLFQNTIKDVLGKFLYDRTKRRPMVIPVVMEI